MMIKVLLDRPEKHKYYDNNTRNARTHARTLARTN